MTEDPDAAPSKFAPWIANFAPAVVVALISIPLSMGIAIACGVPPARGLITAIIGGLVIGRLSGGPLQISGPSAGIAVMVLDLVTRHGLIALGVVVPVMGILQATAGLLRLGQYFRAVSPAVINAMLAGIGVLIFAAQFHVMVDDVPKGSGLRNLLSIPGAVTKGVWPLDGSVHQQAALIGLLTLGVLVGMSLFKKGKLSKVPPPLVAVVIATGATTALGLEIRRVDMPDSFLAALAFPRLSDVTTLLGDPSVILSAVALAFAASAETMLCSSAVDGMHDNERTDYDRELLAQGVGNFFCGILGAPPASGVITRSTANVQAGATGRQSAMMVGMLLLAFVAAFPTLLEVVPRACLAAILVYVGYNLVRNRPYAELRRYGKSELLIFAITITVIVGVNLLTGIVTGVVLALAKLLYSLGGGAHKFGVEIRPDFDHRLIQVHLTGAASFIRLPRLAATLETLPRDQEIHLHVEDLDYIDHACLDILTKWERQRIQSGTPVRVEWSALHHKYHSRNPLDATPPEHAESPDRVHRLLDFIVPSLVYVDERYPNKNAAIEVLGRHLVRHYHLKLDGDALIDSAKRREQESSTCLGGGLMIPHGILRSRKDQLGVMAISKRGWNFETPDGQPVHCIVFLATPQDAAAQHLAVLAAFARLFRLKPELRDQLIAAGSGAEVVELLRSDEAAEINYAFERVTG